MGEMVGETAAVEAAAETAAEEKAAGVEVEMVEVEMAEVEMAEATVVELSTLADHWMSPERSAGSIRARRCRPNFCATKFYRL